jgi:aromatic ring-opening dioxygenase catalytic subunit (LigB family)
MVSAHWEAPVFTLQGAAHPGMVYDYYGFPEHTHHVQYACPGAPELAARTLQLILAAGLPGEIDRERGYDHGMFAPMAVMFPAQDVPVVQLSLLHGLQPQAHVQLGRSIAALRDEGVLIVGSGLSYHNMQAFGSGAGQADSAAFDGWLQDTLLRHEGSARTARLLHWERAPAARQAHPREEHLLPLMVAVGAAESDSATCVYHEERVFGRITVSSYRLG